MRTTAEIAPHGARPAISLRPAPSCEPPFDDELEPTVWATAHQLALDWPSPPPPEAAAAADRAPSRSHAGAPASGGLPPIDSRWLTGPRPRDAASAGSGPRGAAAVAHGQPPGHRQTVAGASADAKLAVRRFVRMCVEVLNGHRPPAHLRRLSRPAEAAEVVAQALVGTYRVAEMRKQSSRRPPRRPLPVAVIRLRLCEPRPGAVEAAVAMVIGERTWAMALRLELHQDIWSATTLRLI